MFDEYHDEINNIVNVLLDSFIFGKERVLLEILWGFVHGSVRNCSEEEEGVVCFVFKV
jgi:hypothetical protein